MNRYFIKGFLAGLAMAGVIFLLYTWWSSQTLTYRNDEFGFQLELPINWRGYQTRELTGDERAAGAIKRIDIGFPTNDPAYGEDFAAPLSIFVYDPASWDQIRQLEGPQPTEIGATEKYVFAYSTWQDAPTDGLLKKIGPFDPRDILQTFTTD